MRKGTRVVSGDVPGLRRFPSGEGKTTSKMASMKENSKLGHYGNNPVPENAALVKMYKNPKGELGNKRTVEDNITGTKIESTMTYGKPGIANHTVGHLGSHKI
jgi:hypothetical protein